MLLRWMLFHWCLRLRRSCGAPVAARWLVTGPRRMAAPQEQIKVAAVEVRGTLESIRSERARLEKERQESASIVANLAAARARHEASLTAATEQHQAECERREGKLAERERGLIARDRQLAADREALDALRSDLERRLAAIKAAAA